MDLKRFTEVMDAYGGNPARWPLTEREAARAFLRDSAEARALVADVASLDSALDAAEEVSVPAALMGRVLASRQAGGALAGKLRALWPGRQIWRPAFALAMSAVLGLGVGLSVPVFPIADDDDDGIEIAVLWLGDNDVLDFSTEIEENGN